MYPRLLEIPLGGTSLTIYSYGFMVAVAILTGSWLIGVELNRMQAQGRIGLLSSGPQDRKNNKKSKKGPRQKGNKIRPADLVGTMTILAAVFGVAGSKFFHILENFDQFMSAPADMIFSTGGLTFYGGLITAGIAIALYARSKGMHIPSLADASAPSLMLGYGIGRIGCHLAGDGDWGIASSLADKPGFIPNWLWSETYPNNILGIGIPDPGVFPTSIYEFVACAVLFGILWAMRKHPFKPGWLFMVYLAFNGMERFLIEKIRVNNEFSLLGLQVTQAEIISSTLFMIGFVGTIWLTWSSIAARKLAANPS